MMAVLSILMEMCSLYDIVLHSPLVTMDMTNYMHVDLSPLVFRKEKQGVVFRPTGCL